MEQYRICSAERAEKQAAGAALDRIALDDPGRRASAFNSNAKPTQLSHTPPPTNPCKGGGKSESCSLIQVFFFNSRRNRTRVSHLVWFASRC